MPKVLSVVDASSDNVSFDEVKSWFNDHMHVDAIDFSDPEPYKVYENARWAGVFQATGRGAQKLFERAKPKSITDIAALTSIYRPGPLAANVDKLYLEAKAGKFYDWGDHRINDLLSDTHGCVSGDTKVMTDHGEISIEDIVKNQMQGITLPSYNEVSGCIEQDEIVAAVFTGVKETIEIETDYGFIKLTDDHLVMTERGWVRADQLTIDDNILGVQDYTYLSGAALKDEQENEQVSNL